MNLYELPRWADDQKIYANDIAKFSLDAFGLEPTAQQAALYQATTTYRKTSAYYDWDQVILDAYLIMALHNLLFKPDSWTVILAPRKSHATHFLRLRSRFLLERLSENSLAYLTEFVVQKAYSLNLKGREQFAKVEICSDHSENPVTLAGIFNDNYLFLAFDAARIQEIWLQYGFGNMCHETNRTVFTQRLGPNLPEIGFFYETQHQLSQNHKNAWKAFSLVNIRESIS